MQKRSLYNLKERKGAVLITVVITMSLLIMLASALYMTLMTERTEIFDDTVNEQLYQTAVSVNDWVFDYLDQYISSFNGISNASPDDIECDFIQWMMNADEDDNILLSDGNTLPGIMGNYSILIELVDEENSIFDITTIVKNENGQTVSFTRIVEFIAINDPLDGGGQDIHPLDGDGFYEAAYGFGTKENRWTVANTDAAGLAMHARTYFGNMTSGFGHAWVSARLDAFGDLNPSGGTNFTGVTGPIEINIGRNLNWELGTGSRLIEGGYGGIVRVGGNLQAAFGVAPRTIVYCFGNMLISDGQTIADDAVVYVNGNFNANWLGGGGTFFVNGNVTVSGGTTATFYYRSGEPAPSIPGGATAEPLSSAEWQTQFTNVMENQKFLLEQSIGVFTIGYNPATFRTQQIAPEDFSPINITEPLYFPYNPFLNTATRYDWFHPFRAPMWDAGRNPRTDRNDVLNRHRPLSPYPTPPTVVKNGCDDCIFCVRCSYDNDGECIVDCDPGDDCILCKDYDIRYCADCNLCPAVAEVLPGNPRICVETDVRDLTIQGSGNRIFLNTHEPVITITESGYIDTSITTVARGLSWHGDKCQGTHAAPCPFFANPWASGVECIGEDCEVVTHHDRCSNEDLCTPESVWGLLPVTQNGAEINTRTIIVDTTNGSDDPNDHKDIFIRLCANQPSRANSFRWLYGIFDNAGGHDAGGGMNPENVWVNIIVRGAGNVVFFMDDGVRYAHMAHVFIGHEGWVRELELDEAENIAEAFNVNMDAPDSYKNRVARYIHGLSYCTFDGCIYCCCVEMDGTQPVLNEHGTPEIKESCSDSDCINLKYGIRLEFGRFLIRQDNTPTYGTLIERSLDDLEFIHNNIFLVDDRLGLTNRVDFLGRRNVLMGFIYAPGLTLNTNESIYNSSNSAHVIGGMLWGAITGGDIKTRTNPIHVMPAYYYKTDEDGNRQTARNVVYDLIGEAFRGMQHSRRVNNEDIDNIIMSVRTLGYR
jgi:hypothetical protein